MKEKILYRDLLKMITFMHTLHFEAALSPPCVVRLPYNLLSPSIHMMISQMLTKMTYKLLCWSFAPLQVFWHLQCLSLFKINIYFSDDSLLHIHFLFEFSVLLLTCHFIFVLAATSPKQMSYCTEILRIEWK